MLMFGKSLNESIYFLKYSSFYNFSETLENWSLNFVHNFVINNRETLQKNSTGKDFYAGAFKSKIGTKANGCNIAALVEDYSNKEREVYGLFDEENY